MGNCTGYCTGCQEGPSRYENQQVRNSYKDKDYMAQDGFGQERYSGGSQNDYYNNGITNKGINKK